MKPAWSAVLVTTALAAAALSMVSSISCQVRPGEPGLAACAVGARHCSEWVVVVRSDASIDESAAWLQARGWPVRRRVDALRMLMAWLPVGPQGGPAAALVAAQPWAALVTPQAQLP